MQHVATSSRLRPEKVAPSNTRSISLYLDPPQTELSLDEFEMLSLDRLQLLRAMEMLQAKGVDDVEFNGKLFEVSFTRFHLPPP